MSKNNKSRITKVKVSPEVKEQTYDDLELIEAPKPKSEPVSNTKSTKEKILKDIDGKIQDIETLEAHSSWRQMYFGYCLFSLIAGILLVLFGLGVTDLFRSTAPTGGTMFVVLGIGGCCFFPFFFWTCIRFCPFRSYAEKKEVINVKRLERLAVDEKRLRYLYSMDEEAAPVQVEQKVTAQMRLALINAQFSNQEGEEERNG